MQFKFDEENLGLTQDQIDHLTGKIQSVELNLQSFFRDIQNDEPISFGKILKVVCSSDLTKEELEFTVTSMIFNDIITNDSQNGNEQAQQLLDLINQLSEKEDNEDAL